jgi:hypothetical protein
MSDKPQQNIEEKKPPEGPPVAGDWDAITPLLKEWSESAHGHQLSNYEAARVFRRRYTLLGIPLVILTGLVGTGIFATIKNGQSIWERVVVGVVGVATAALAAAQTFLRYGERAEKHHSVAVRYGAIKHDVAATLALPVPLRGEAKKYLETVKAQIDAVAADAPDIDWAIYYAARPKDDDKKNKDKKKKNDQAKSAKGEPPDEIF